MFKIKCVNELQHSTKFNHYKMDRIFTPRTKFLCESVSHNMHYISILIDTSKNTDVPVIKHE